MSEGIELDLNEMPYPPPQNVIQAARDSLEYLNRYTELSAIRRIRELLADYAGVAGEQIVIGPGSDLLLREIVLCFAAGRKAVMASPTFLPTVQVARRFAAQLVSIRLSQPEFSLAKEPLLEELTEPSLVIIDNPNNPTGRLLLDRETVENILDMPDTLLVVDEAYLEFSGLTFAELVAEHANLAIARTLLIDPRILIFDDSTSSVDTETEFLIQKALRELMKGRTTFVIAQRLQTVRDADQILVLDKGTIAERGSHAELLEHGTIYRQIYEIQLRDQEEALNRRYDEP